jgi:hypothetical protein
MGARRCKMGQSMNKKLNILFGLRVPVTSAVLLCRPPCPLPFLSFPVLSVLA